MTDGIKLYFTASRFKGNFDNCILQEQKEDRTEWRLYNPQNRSHMSIWRYNNDVVTIKGSLRKWYFGNNSVKGLTLVSCIEATNHIAERLGLSWESLCSAKISQVEFGLNIPISIPFSILSKKIVSYGTHRKRDVIGKGRTKGNYGTLYFGEHKSKYGDVDDNKHDCEFRLKIYDKYKEIEDKRDFVDYTILPDTNILRIEFTADDKDTFKRKGLPRISNIKELIQNWQSLYELWAREVGRIILLSNIYDVNSLDTDAVLFSEAISIDGWNTLMGNIEEYASECFKTKASANSAKTKIHKRINNLLDNHSNPNEYRKINLYKDIIAYMIDIKSAGEDINISRMIALLHSSTHYSGYEEINEP